MMIDDANTRDGRYIDRDARAHICSLNVLIIIIDLDYRICTLAKNAYDVYSYTYQIY